MRPATSADAADVPDLELTVIVPVLNEAENLPRLLPRIAHALRWRSYEVILVDDGSTDGTVDLAQKLAADYPLRILRGPALPTASRARC